MNTNHPATARLQFSDETHALEAVYIRFCDVPSAETREWSKSQVFADYDENGDVIGLELLGPFEERDKVRAGK